MLLLASNALASHPNSYLQVHAASSKHPKVVRNATIVAETKAETRARHRREWREKYRSFVYPSGRHFAVPFPIATCESGENYFVGPAGAYGLIFYSWLPPKRQDEIAFGLYERYGEEPWAPYESACAYR